MTRIRTLEFLPSIFQTPTNSQFLGATLDQLVNPPVTKKIEGFVGSKLGYGINANDYYVTEPSKPRKDYQLEPGVVFTKKNESVAKDFISYPGILDALKLQNGIIDNNDRLFNSQFYSWDSFTNLDMIINYNQYYWLPEGPPAVTVASSTVFRSNEFIVQDTPTTYNIRAIGSGAGSDNPTITLLRGGTYTFTVNQDSQFWIQGEPGVTGFSPIQTNLYTRDIYGVTNNGATSGVITFNVPQKNAQNEYLFPGNNPVGVVSNKPFSQINGGRVNVLGGIDGVTSLNGRTVMFYDTTLPNEIGYVSSFYSEGNYDTNTGLVSTLTINATSIDSSGYITVSDTANLNVGQTITFTGTSFGNIETYNSNTANAIASNALVAGEKYFIGNVGNTDWISAGLTSSATLDAEIVGTELRINKILSGSFATGMTLSGGAVAVNTKIVEFDPIASDSNYLTVDNVTIGNLYAIRSFLTDDGQTTDFTQMGATAAGIITANISGNVLTVDSISSGSVPIGSYITGSGITTGTYIVERIYSGENPTNQYVVNKSQTVGSTTITVQPGLGSWFVATAAGTNTGTVSIPTYAVDVSQNVSTGSIDVYNIATGQFITATGPVTGTGTAVPYNVSIYYVAEINSGNIRISQTLGGPIFAPGVVANGNLTAYINQGLYEEGYYINVNDYFFTITLVGDLDDPVIQLTPAGLIPTEEKIVAQYGTEYVGLGFFKNNAGAIEQIPYLSAPLDTLYYQDGTSPTKVGVIRIIENNNLNTLNVDTEILGQKNFTSTNGVVFTNGLKVTFDGDVLPTSYLQGEYYVQGVGTAIELISVTSLIVPESYTDATSVPYDSLPYDIGNYDSNLYIPLNPDYITIARNSRNLNPWARSNRWFHIQVIQDTANYLDNPSIVTTYASAANKAQRPIIEFYPNLKLFNTGTIAKNAVDFVDNRTVDPFNLVAGQATYYPDVETYTTYTGSIQSNPNLITGTYLPSIIYKIQKFGTTVLDTWLDVGAQLVYDGDFVPGVEYIIWDLGVTTQAEWNIIAGTTGVTYAAGDKFIATDTGTVKGTGSGTALTVEFTAQQSGDYNSNDLLPSTEYFISEFGTTNWVSLGATEVNLSTLQIPLSVGSLVIGQNYSITELGDTTQTEWNTIAGTTGVTYEVGSNFTCVTTGTGTGKAGVPYYIKSLGGLSQFVWNNICGTSKQTYSVGDLIVPIKTLGLTAGLLVKRQFTTNSIVSGLPYSSIGTGFAYQGTGVAQSQTVTTITIDADQVTGNLTAGMYINDLILGQESQLPFNSRIWSIEGTDTLTINVFWPLPAIIPGTSNNASFVASTKNNTDLLLFPGARIAFTAEQNPQLRDKIYVANFSTLNSSFPVITLTEAVDGQLLENDQFVVTRGQNNQGSSYYFNGENFVLAQAKNGVNQQPKFDIFDNNGISFGNENIYESTTFNGNDLFRYKLGVGINDSVLGFPISYSSINNVGDITFEVALNSDTFNYVSGLGQNEPITQDVNTGFIHNYVDRTNYELLTGWQTAIAPSVQYQVFEFDYVPNVPQVLLDSGETITYTVTCDVPTLSRTETVWPNLQVFNNNTLLVENTDYVVTYNETNTEVDVFLTSDTKTVIQVLLLSDQVSQAAYYSIPINLSNNPFNTDITTVDTGDIRGHYQTIFYNNPDTTGIVFGSNNTRDLGNIAPYGTRIIQNSASLVLPGAFLRQNNHNLFDALEYNSREYIKFKTLLVDTVNKTSYQQKFDPAFILDDALDQISSVKNQDMPFFWSDMIPNKASYITNIYTLQNDTLETAYPLSKVYDFTSANYDGVLVYIETTVNNVKVVKQLYKDIDYTISTDSPALTITKSLVKGDKVIIKEYNQTYGSFVPNTPTKLGLYPLSIPAVILDTTYNEPTYFIKGHDGSYTKLYGEYNPELDLLVDYRDQALLEFEIRVYNNIKLSSIIPLSVAEVTPGYFRNTTFSYDEWLQMYSTQFLNWIGQNRLDYKTQIYQTNNPYTYNYKNSQNKLDNTRITQGYWRGIYEYYYDTSTPNLTPWAMLGYANKPTWWENQYGPAPYTSDNLILWQDLENGYDYNDGNPVVRENYKRPGLLDILPVDNQGNLVQPFYSVVGNYNNNTLQRDWVIGDDSPVEYSYRKSSTYPFDLMRLFALMQPANFFNLAVDLDNYKYDPVINQFLYNGRGHLVPSELQVYGDGIAKTSYINWIVDYEKQLGIGATDKILELLNNLDVRLVYRLAGFSDKTLLKFFVEKGTPDSRNASLLIPDESYQILLYENQAYETITYSSVVIQLDNSGYRVYGNSQSKAYFTVLKPINNSNKSKIVIQDAEVTIANDYSSMTEVVPYGTLFYTRQELAQFLTSYGKYLQSQGMQFAQIESGIEVNWQQMVAEFLYWSQVGWQIGSIVTLNPAANSIVVDKESRIVQPLTLQQNNFILNQNLYPIDTKNLSIFRDGSLFSATAQNQGDTIAYAQFNLSNLEHGLVFDNQTLFNDIIYNLISGLKQNRIYVRGTKSAEWNGTMFASGFIYNQDNIQEWTGDIKYTKGSIVKYKNKYWTALKIIQAGSLFNEIDWKETEYDEIQKGLLPNSSTRSYESSLYYNVDKANLEQDADQLSFSLIGFRPRPYMASADLTDITQVNVYKNMIKQKGTRNVLNAFKNAQLPQGGIDYDIYENWAILQGTFGGVLNDNFVEFKLNQSKLTSNPFIVGLTSGNNIEGAEQLVPLYSLYNYKQPITNTNILPTLDINTPSYLFPDAGYVNVNDVKMSAYFYSNLPTAVDKNGQIVPISRFYVNDYVWLANYLASWQILTPYSIGQVVQVRSNLNGTSTVFFDTPHNLQQFNIFSIINFDDTVNGYYIATQIVNPYQVIINLELGNSNRIVTGEGIALGFNNSRVSKPSDIQNLPLLNYEFTKNKVWVDENTDGSWAVYQKSNNYKYDIEFTRENSINFGQAVNYTAKGDYLISDSESGKVFRYQFDPLTGEYDADQTLSLGNTFGTAIASAENILAISKPRGVNKFVYLGVVNDTTFTDDIRFYQYNNGFTPPLVPGLIAPAGSTNFGAALAFSDDTNYLFVSDYDEVTPTARNKIQVYRKNNVETVVPFTPGQTYRITELGDTDFTAIGAVENKVGIYFVADGAGIGTGKASRCNYELVYTIDGPNTTVDKFGHSLSTNYYGDTLVVGAPYEDYDGTTSNWGRSYVYQRAIQNFEAPQTGTNLEFTLVWPPDTTKPLSVYINGSYVQATEYSIVGTTLTVSRLLTAGDIITVSGNEFILVQVLETEQAPRIGVQFGYSVDNNVFGTEILVGAPFAISNNNQEGAVYRYTYAGKRFGYVVGTTEVNVTTTRTLLLNGYAVSIPAGNAEIAADAINNANITNIEASHSNNILTINVINADLTQVNQKLTIGVIDLDTLSELGIELYTQTQVVLCPHNTGATQFGTTVKFNEHNSFVVSAPVGTRFALTTFDFTDDTNLDNDTLFDNNATQFLDSFDNAGAVYMFDYLENYNESLSNIGAYTYAQSCNAQDLDYGQQPYYGTALDFIDNKVIIGTPNYRPNDIDGQVVIYLNEVGTDDWTVLRNSSPVVDINGIQNTQLFSAESNKTLINLDYFDPLQGKLLGAVRQNIDVISNTDPASYNNSNNTQSGFVWGSAQVGTIWFDTTNVRFLNYHQNDNSYNARYWGTLFPGSDVAVYSWIASDVPPADYQGNGEPRDISLFTVQTTLNSSNQITPVYYYWVRNTGSVFAGKSLADITISEYIANPQASGISYLAPILPDAFALYNSQVYVNANDTVLHIGYGTTAKDDPSHQEYCLIRENFASDFLPGLPNVNKGIDYPESLYDRFLDSLSGVDEAGGVVPDPFLPKNVQSGVLARPRQSFFYNRFLALNNYLEYCNSILALYPISELRRPTYLNESGTYFDTANFWEYVNWWAIGYNNNTKSAYQVQNYADLSALSVPAGTIVTVAQNSQGLSETYIYDTEGVWTRIGLQNGTIRFKTELYNYNEGKYGFGGDFFSTTPFDQYPSEETRWIIRAINEQIFTNDLLIFRNKALILLFEYIQAETVENQNYLPWLNKTSLIDVSHKIRELIPLQNFNSDNQEFLSGYVNEAKPYHVVVKEFLFDYTGQDIYQGNLTDFDLPATFDDTINNFVSPELVYSNPNTDYEFLPDDPVWQKPEYTQWFENYGVSLTGENNYLITQLASYVTLGSDFIVVDNAQGFPINGVIKIADLNDPTRFEYISYNSVNRALNTLSGLVRGVNETEPFDHIPGENIYIDLPAVVVLDGGRSYSDAPRVIAYIDESKYPAPKEEAVLEAVMSLDSVVSINVVNPGKGYAVLPEIIIDPSETFTFDSTKVNLLNNTIEVYAPSFQTSDLVRYVSGLDNVGGLKDGQYYYVNVLDTTPTSIIALYTTYKDAINDTNRVKLLSQGQGTQKLELGAKASAISSSYPVRENNITIRFDRTTYGTQVQDWVPSTFYGAFFAGSYNNTENVASSSIELESTNPDINTLLASNSGLVLPVESVENDRLVEWSSFERVVVATSAISNVIELDVNVTTENASGSTVGFTVGMPIKFIGTVGSSNLVSGTTYYINEIVSDTEFKISATENGPVFALGNESSLSLSAYTAQVVDTAIINTRYPGIREVVASNATHNSLTVPLSPIGTGGTQGLYTGIPVIFTGATFGGLEENVVYYVTSVLDSETFTISETNNPLTLEVTSINAANQLIMASIVGLNVNDKIVFSNMMIDNVVVTSFGGINKGQIYYVKEIGINVITLSETLGGSELVLSPVTQGSNTYAFFTSQENTLDLTTATGSMTMNIQLPASPGQVNGKQFTFYQTSDQYADLPGITVGNLVEKTIEQVLAAPNSIAFDGNFDRLYNGLPFTVDTITGGLYTGKTYYMYDFANLTMECDSTFVSVCTINASFTGTTMTVTSRTGDGYVYPGSVITGTGINDSIYVVEQLSGTPGETGTYRVDYEFVTTVSLTGLTSRAGVVSTPAGVTTDVIYQNMAITFEGQSLGGINIGQQYYVRHIIDNDSFIISLAKNQASVILGVNSGIMLLVGSSASKVYLKAGSFEIGDQYDILTLGTTQYELIGATLDINNVSGFTVGETYIIKDLGTTSQTAWNSIAGTLGVVYAEGDTFVCSNSTSGIGDGAAYVVRFTASGAGTGTGTATVILANSGTTATLTQEILSTPTFDISYILGGYRAIINNAGSGFTVNNTITIAGNLVGGSTPKNDVTLTVDQINAIIAGEYSWSLPLESNGEITKVICSGTVPGVANKYFLKVRTANSFEVYSDPRMTIPVSGVDFPYQGYVETNIVDVGYVSPFPGQPYTDITLNDASDLEVNDAVTFTNLDNAAYTITEGATYYVVSKFGNTIRVSSDPGNDPVAISDASIADTNVLVAKAGSFTVLPEPFYFDQSIVKYNNRVYVCIVSNNDDEFIFGKWQELNSGDRRLNAMDRVKGYYQPTVNMPGAELQQVFTGITYPNTTYKGNAFDPADQFSVDTLLQDQPFYPTNANIPAIVFNGQNYMAPVNLPNYSGFAADIEVSDDWLLAKIADRPLALTDLILNNHYVMTTNNSATPIMTSSNGSVWTTNGFYVPYNTPVEDIPYVKSKLISNSLSLNAVTYGNNKHVAAGDNIITTNDLSVWIETYAFTGEFFDVQYVQTSFFTGFVAVGTKDGSKFIVYSTDGSSWAEVTAYNNGAATVPQQNATLKGISYDNNSIVVVGELGVIYRATAINNWTFVQAVADNLNAVLYADNLFVAVGDNGYIYKSANGTSWTQVLVDTTENLNAVHYLSSNLVWTIVGDNNTVLQTLDIDAVPVNWDTTQIFSTPNPAYTVQGDPFQAGYGPEELVPGIVTDQLTMIVTTRAGTNWPADEYAHVGYDVVSLELDSDVTNEYSFADVVQIPAQVGVFLLSDGLSVSLYVNNDYTVDWINKTITLTNNITGTDKLRIDVYEVGNGDQLVKSNTDNDPIVTNATTGLDEIYLNCNYSGQRITGGGIVQPYTDPIDDIATETDSNTDTITVGDVGNFILNGEIFFQGNVFGGVTENTPYYVKSINSVRNTITISDTLVDGVAGTVFDLTDATGSMTVVIQTGPGEFYSEPAMYYNGNRLVSGRTNTVIQTKSSNNAIVTYSTVGLVVNQRIVFGNTMIGGLNPHQTYYVSSILSATEFTVSETLGGAIVTLTNAVGSAIFVTEDFAATVAENGINAKIIFSIDFDQNVDYLAYSFLSETEPAQYGYTLPQTEVIQGTGISVYNLSNYIGETNAVNAIVEVDGLRIMPDQYTISPAFDNITFDTLAPNSSQTIAVTTFNDTQRQYLNTQYEASTVQVTPIIYVNNVITATHKTVTVQTGIPHNLSDNDVIRIDGVSGSYQLNDQLFIINVISATEFDLYEYVPGNTYEYSAPITAVNTYSSGGFVWLANSWIVNNLAPFPQTNVDRLWVTVNGERVASSSLRLNVGNELSILAPINLGDEVIITSMMPSATPDEMVYINTVNSEGKGTVYRANGNTRTWLTKSVGQYDTTIQVANIDKITNKNTQTNIAPVATLGYHVIALNATKNDIVSITVYNNNPARLGFIEPDYIQLEVTGTGPYVKITEGGWIESGDELTIVTLEGNVVYINGEYMRIESIDTDTNICDVARGVNGSPVLTFIPKYSEVYSLLEDNQMNEINYNTTWNKIPGLYNTTEGDPLQIAVSSGADFLRLDV